MTGPQQGWAARWRAGTARPQDAPGFADEARIVGHVFDQVEGREDIDAQHRRRAGGRVGRHDPAETALTAKTKRFPGEIQPQRIAIGGAPREPQARAAAQIQQPRPPAAKQGRIVAGQESFGHTTIARWYTNVVFELIHRAVFLDLHDSLFARYALGHTILRPIAGLFQPDTARRGVQRFGCRGVGPAAPRG